LGRKAQGVGWQTQELGRRAPKAGLQVQASMPGLQNCLWERAAHLRSGLAQQAQPEEPPAQAFADSAFQSGLVDQGLGQA
jgi:hypothetical protein